MRRIWVTVTPIDATVRAAASAAGATEIVNATNGYPPALLAIGINTSGYHEIPVPAVPVSETNRQTIEGRAITAITANNTFLAIGTPSTAQNAAQIKLLTRECNGLIMLLLNRLDTTNGT